MGRESGICHKGWGEKGCEGRLELLQSLLHLSLLVLLLGLLLFFLLEEEGGGRVARQ